MDRHSSKCDPIVNISKDHAGESSHYQGSVSNPIPMLGDDDDYFQNTFGIYSSFHTQPKIQDEARHSSKCDPIVNISKDRVGESSRDQGNVSNPKPILGDDDDYFQNTFGTYSSFHTQPIIQDEEMVVEEAASREVERKQKEHKPKQKRCGKMHTISERRRRERIRVKIQALQELIPNCNKWDKASILDDAINYIKSLKLQAEMMSMASGPFFQVPYMSPAGVQSQQVTQFPPVMHMRLAGPAGMAGMCFSPTGQASPMAPFPMQSPLSVPAGMPLMPGIGTGTGNLGLPHMQMPFYHAPTMLPNFHALGGVPHALYNYSSQGESSSLNMPQTSSIDCLQMPLTRQIPLEDQVSENFLTSSSPSKFQSSYP